MPVAMAMLLCQNAPGAIECIQHSRHHVVSTASPNDSNELLPDTEVKELLARISLQEKEAFDILYNLTGSMLYSISYSLMGNDAEAKDAFQESLVKIWKRAGDYNPAKGNAVAWLSRVTRNTSLDKLRARKRLHAAIDRAAENAEVESTREQMDTSAGQHLISKERADRLKQEMAKLPATQRTAIELAFLKGMTQTEVADHLGEPLGTIKARIRRGMLKLQSSLNTYPG